MDIRKGDTVVLLTGKDRGKKGKVTQVLPRQNRLVIEGLNLLTKHVRPRRQGQKGERVQVAAPVHVAKVQCICPHCGKATRLGFRIEAGKKHRFCRRCQTALS